MTSIARALSRATQQIGAASDTPRLDAELLMAEALNVDRDRLLLSPQGKEAPERFWRVYEREDEPCVRCGTWIKRIVQGGRSTYYCPKCQRN